MKKVIVIGAGASGMVSAIKAALNKCEVTILEKNNTNAKKLLVTGNGKCNYWNSDFTLNHFNSSNMGVLNKIILNKNKALEFFDYIGIIPRIKNGYYYPFSNQSTSVLNALMLQIKLLNIKIVNNVNVTKIEKKKGFILNTNKGEYFCDKLIYSVGSKAFIKDEFNGYDMIESLGHSIIKPLPALTQLNGKENYFKDWAGARSDVSLKLYENGKFIKEEFGEAQFTNYGISGICVYQLSSNISRGLDKDYLEELKINFLPFLKNKENAYNWFETESNKIKNRTIIQILDCVLNYKLGNLILKQSRIDLNKTFLELNKSEKEKFISNLISFKLKIVSTSDFLSAQVCSGGVPLDEINPITMESLKVKGLYLTGEILDVDGNCGGYNLGFAFITGILAGEGVNHD